MHIFSFHIFSWGTAVLLVLLPALIQKSFGSAAGGNWCWIRGDALITRIAFHDLFLLLATSVFIVSCILTAMRVRVLNGHDGVYHNICGLCICSCQGREVW